MVGIKLKREFESLIFYSCIKVKVQLYVNTLISNSMDDLKQCEQPLNV